MESAALGLDAGAAPSDPGAQPDPNMASMRRRAWAQSRDSWQEPESEPCSPQGPQQNPRDSARGPSEEPGHVPNKITSWLSECRTPLGASLDDQTASPTRGVLRNGCSFEDDLSLGAEANHLQSSNKKTEPRFGLAADQKRSQYKERGRSMNSTGSGKSSTVSSVSELLDLYEEDPEEILLNLGFGRDEPDMSAKVPSRFFNSSSSARGIDIKVYLGAQLQRMEVENPNYALTSRFRQIEVLTTVANEFIQLYSQVSGQPLQRISSRDQGDAGQGRKEDASPPQKRRAPALNAAKLIKKSISKHNLLMASGDSPDARTPQPQLNGHADHALTNGHAHSGPEQDGRAGESDHQAETVNQKHCRKKDSCSLATVDEETNGDGETDRLTDDSPAPNGRCQPQSADQQVTREEVEKNFTSTPEKAPHSLTSPQLAHLRTEKTDSFDMEEIQSNDDDALLPRISRNFDLLRTVSQQSDSSGFAEEPSVDCSSLKVQESSDSCDSETTVTSHASEDAATPLALDQPAFEMPESRKVEVEPEPSVAAVANGRSSSKEEEDEHVGSPVQVLQYSAHQLPRIRPDGSIENDAHDEEQSAVQAERLVLTEEQTASGPQPPVDTQNLTSLPLEPQQTENSSEATAVPETPTGEVCSEEQVQVEEPGDGLPFPPPPASPVLCALNRAKQNQLNREGQRSDPHHGTSHVGPGRGRGRGGIPLQRSSSLPSSLLSPSRVVSSVRIQFGRGQASCSQPRYSFRYTQENGGDEGKQEEEKEKKEANCLSTLIINQGASANQLVEASTPLKPIPGHLVRSSNSLHSPSPPPDWSPGGDVLSWSTQSVPDLSSTRQHLGPFHQSTMANASQQSANPGQVMFPYHSSPNPSPHHNPNPFAFGLNAPSQYPAPLYPYASLPNLLHPHQPHHHSSLTSLHHGAGSTLPQYDAPQNLHHAPSAPHHSSMGNLHPGTPTMHQPGYGPPHGHQQPYHAAPHFASPYLGYNGYAMHPHLAYAHLYPMVSPEQQHLHHRGHTPPTAGLHPGLVSHAPGMSSTEMQLRRVLHDIRGTVQSLSQSRAGTPDVFTERRAAPASNQSLADFQQKRRSLNLFRNQMMDLELSIIRQQALVYKHLSPADRLEVEQLQSLRSAVREELQELEQQLEDRLMELTQQTQHKRLHREGSIDSLSTTSALRAMDPVSDLLREQLFLQSELSYDDRAPSTAPSSRSSRSSSPVRGRGGGGGGDQGQGTFRATINITPAPPPRPNANDGEEEKDDGDSGGDGGGGDSGGGVGEGDDFPQKGGETGGVKVENLQQLIKEIRESVAQEVRQEIFSELMAAVSPRR